MRIALLSAVAKLLRVQFKVDGQPYGARLAIEPGDCSLSSR
jgi:hypothetical protein